MKYEKPDGTVSPSTLVLGVIPDEPERVIRNLFVYYRYVCYR
ncbi:TPA: hypothetical protein ACRZ3R_001598 [Vibrio harveyi]